MKIKDVPLRDYSMEQIKGFLHDDELSPEALEIVQRFNAAHRDRE